MNPGHTNEQTLVDYLLGRLPEAEQGRMEERLFTEDGLDEELLATADDLIHAYVSGSLSDEDRRRFETHFLAQPRHRERLAFIRDLGQAVGEVAASRQDIQPSAAKLGWSWKHLWPLAAAATLLVVALLVVLQRRIEAPPSVVTSSNRPPSPPSSPGASSSPSPATTPTTIPETSTVRVVRLPQERPSLVPVRISDSTRSVRVEVAVPEGPPSFDVILQGSDGKEAWRRESLAPPPSGRRLVFSLPAEVLQGEAYNLRIEGEPLRDVATPPVLEYRLRVVRER